MSQNALLSLLAVVVIGVAALLLWCAGANAPSQTHRGGTDVRSIPFALPHPLDDSRGRAATSPRQPGPHSPAAHTDQAPSPGVVD